MAPISGSDLDLKTGGVAGGMAPSSGSDLDFNPAAQPHHYALDFPRL